MTVHNNGAVWSTRTQGNPGSVLQVQDDANMVVRAPGNWAVWASGWQHSGYCTDGDRGRSQQYANSGAWYNPVPSVYWTQQIASGGSPTNYNYKLEVRYNPADRCAYALLSGGAWIMSDKVYLDRSTDGGRTWTGWLGTQSIGLGNWSAYTGAFRDGKGFWIRACSPRGGNQYRCTGWF